LVVMVVAVLLSVGSSSIWPGNRRKASSKKKQERKYASPRPDAVCTYRNSSGCLTLGNYYYAKKRYYKAHRYFRTGCRKGYNAVCCRHLGYMWLNYKTTIRGWNRYIRRRSRNYVRMALKYYELACKYNDGIGCFSAGKILRDGGYRVGINEDLALDYFQKGCSLRDRSSCEAKQRAIVERREAKERAEREKAHIARERRQKVKEPVALCLKIPSGRRDFQDLYKVFSHINRCVIKLKKHSGTEKVVKKLEIIMIKLYPLISNICKRLRSLVFRRIRVGRRTWQGRSAIQFNLCLRMLQYFRSKGINVNKIKRLVLRRCKALGGSCREVRRQVTPKARRNSRKRGRVLVCSSGNNSYWCMIERAKKSQRRAGRSRAMRLKQKRARDLLLMRMASKRLRATMRRNMAKVRRRCRKLKPVCGGQYIHIRNRTNYSKDVTLCYYSSSSRRWYSSTTYALAHTTTRTSKYVSCTYFHYFHVCGCN